MSKTADVARPLTARSIIASTLLGTHPPRMPVASLVRSCELFGIRENAARVALSRMVSAGELVVTEGRYTLVGRLRDRQNRQDESRRGLAPGSRWDGTWVLAVIGPEARSAAERGDLRRTLRQQRFAEWREGVWLRPDNLGQLDRALPPACTLVRGGLPPDPKVLARTLFHTVEWKERTAELLVEIEALARQLSVGDSTVLTSAFVRNAAVLRHLQSDPLLPAELLPKAWPGHRLRERYERFDAAFVARWQSSLREVPSADRQD